MALNSIVGAYGIGTYETSEFKYETVNVRQKMLNGVSVLTFTTKNSRSLQSWVHFAMASDWHPILFSSLHN